MKRSIIIKSWITSLMLLAMQFVVFAQEKVETTTSTVNKANVSSWFERNWMWVTGIAVVLLLIIIFSGSSSRSSRTTTVTRDDFGNTRSVSTTETVE